MKWQYKVSLLFLILSQTVFLTLAAYHTDNEPYYPGGQPDTKPTIGYSWIWYHLEHWIISWVLVLISLTFCVHGLLTDFMQSKNKQDDSKQMGTSIKWKWLTLIIFVIVWIIVIFLSLYFSNYL